MAEKKEKQYVSDNAQLMAEWDWEKNTGTSPNEIMTGSGKTVWWKCLKGQERQARIDSRSKGNGCPQCAREKRKRNKQVLYDFLKNRATASYEAVALFIF